MPWPWISLGVLAAVGQLPVAKPNLIIYSNQKAFYPDSQTIRFEGGVDAYYDVEHVHADSIEVHGATTDQWAVATGHVNLIDPDGTIEAAKIQFSWNPVNRYGTATNAKVIVAGATIRASSVQIFPGTWILNDFVFTTDFAKHPLYTVSGSRITIYPGRRARIEKPTLDVLGGHIVTLPDETLNLDPRSTGIRPPNPEYRANAGFGVNWVSGALLNQTTDLEWHSDFFPGFRPGYGLQVTKTYVSPDKSTTLITPRSELSERFAWGYFENVLVSRPEREIAYLDVPRSAVSFSSNYNAAADGRGFGTEGFTTPVEVTYERGGEFGKFLNLTDLRYETTENEFGPFISRAIAQTSIEAPSLHFAPNLQTLTRLDASLFQSSRTFGWGRLSTGLVYRPLPALTLGAGLVGAFQGGTPDFDIDPLVATNGYVLRADLNLGPRKFSYMTRWDTGLGWWDQEFTASQVAGPLEVYILRRRYPGEYRLGVRLRVDQFSDLLKRRSFKRSTTSTTPNPPTDSY